MTDPLIEAMAQAIERALGITGTLPDDLEIIGIDDAATAALTAHDKHLAEQGLVVVPREPTEEMLTQGACYEDQDHDIFDEGHIAREVYQAMLTAHEQE